MMYNTYLVIRKHPCCHSKLESALGWGIAVGVFGEYKARLRATLLFRCRTYMADAYRIICSPFLIILDRTMICMHRYVDTSCLWSWD